MAGGWTCGVIGIRYPATYCELLRAGFGWLVFRVTGAYTLQDLLWYRIESFLKPEKAREIHRPPLSQSLPTDAKVVSADRSAITERGPQPRNRTNRSRWHLFTMDTSRSAVRVRAWAVCSSIKRVF